MEKITHEEAEYWDEYCTAFTIMPDFHKTGFFSRKYWLMVRLDPKTTKLLIAQAEATQKTFSEIIGELARERIRVSL